VQIPGAARVVWNTNITPEHVIVGVLSPHDHGRPSRGTPNMAVAKHSQGSNKHYLIPRLNIDKGFGIVFEKKVDKRESRSLLFNGRFLLDDYSKPHESIWQPAMAKHFQESNKHYLIPRLNIDKGFGIVFEKKVDKRESRPLLFNGRFLMDGSSKPHESIWRGTPLFLNGRTAEARQMQSSDMTVVEDHRSSFLFNAMF
jgi:hypothetical protein